MELHTGITGVDETEVTQANTAEAVGSGTLPRVRDARYARVDGKGRVYIGAALS